VRQPSRLAAFLVSAALLSACSGGGSGTTSVAANNGGTGSTATPTPATGTASGCTLRERQNWAFATLKEWYLFPDTLPASLDPAGYPDVPSYIDALTATARAQHKDRYFTYLTSIAEEDAYYSSGSSAGFGVRLYYDGTANRVFVTEAFEGAPALAAGIDRGTELLAVGTSAASLRTVSSLMASGGAAAVSDAFGPSTPGTSRVLRIADAAGTRDVTVAKADYSLTPVSSRYGAKILDNGGTPVGYVNLRSYIDTADAGLRGAFARFRAAGVTSLIVDLRYNGGGLLSIAELFGRLMGANRSSSDVFDYTTFRPEKSAENDVAYFAPQPESIAPMRIAFIGTGATASASELTLNGMLPYLRGNLALVGSNTYGKPVGQIAIDRAACDDRFRVIAFAVENRDHQGAYYDGLASKVDAFCPAGDDYTHPLGDPAEASTRAALAFLASGSCPASNARARVAVAPATLAPLMPDRPTTLQREVPGAF
jgi:carboxyl-terminal processing protease